MRDIRTVARFGDTVLYENGYGAYLLAKTGGKGPTRFIQNADARRLESELLISDGVAACSRRMFNLIAESYLC